MPNVAVREDGNPVISYMECLPNWTDWKQTVRTSFDFGTTFSAAARPRVIVNRPTYNRAGYIWVEGYWKWNVYYGSYTWQKARWKRVKRNHMWVPGFWEISPRGFFWVEGYWALEY